MIDRESTLANPEIVALLKTRYVPVAIDQAYQRRQRDAEGEFYRLIAKKGPRSNMQATTQGFYVAAPDGTFLGYSNNRTPDRVRRAMDEAIKKFDPQTTATPIESGRRDSYWGFERPEGCVTLRVHTKVLGGYEPTDKPHERIFQTALARDNMWMTAEERQQLGSGQFPESLAKRIARFHLVDNTRGEPPMWKADEIRLLDFKCDAATKTVSGKVHLKTADNKREFRAELIGKVEFKERQMTRFDVVVKGLFEGDGPYTRRGPEGEFPLAVSFMLADGKDVADEVKPQGLKVVGHGYITD